MTEPEENERLRGGGGRLRPAALLILLGLGLLLSVLLISDAAGPRPAVNQAAAANPDSVWRALHRTDPAQLRYRESARIETGLRAPTALAVRADGRVAVAGDGKIRLFESGGQLSGEWNASGDVLCLAADAEGRLLAGLARRIEVFTPEGRRLTLGEELPPQARLSSLAPGGPLLWAADSGRRRVLGLGPDGRVCRELGGEDAARGLRGLVLFRSRLDVWAGADGGVWVTNPGRHRVEHYSQTVELRAAWGEAKMSLEGFTGCCNPGSLARLPDGRFVTGEKTPPRVKVYSEEGQFEGLVAGPESFAPRIAELDLAADAQGRVLVLDPEERAVRIFEPR